MQGFTCKTIFKLSESRKKVQGNQRLWESKDTKTAIRNSLNQEEFKKEKRTGGFGLEAVVLRNEDFDFVLVFCKAVVHELVHVVWESIEGCLCVCEGFGFEPRELELAGCTFADDVAAFYCGILCPEVDVLSVLDNFLTDSVCVVVCKHIGLGSLYLSESIRRSLRTFSFLVSRAVFIRAQSYARDSAQHWTVVPPNSPWYSTDSLDQQSQHSMIRLPMTSEWAQVEVLPSVVIGIPVMALTITFSYPQPFPGLTAPDSYATRDLGAEIALARTAIVWGRFLLSSPPPMNIAVFA